jgi:hypothetical protein
VIARVLRLALVVSVIGGAVAPVALPAPAQREQAVAALDAGGAAVHVVRAGGIYHEGYACEATRP